MFLNGRRQAYFAARVRKGDVEWKWLDFSVFSVIQFFIFLMKLKLWNMRWNRGASDSNDNKVMFSGDGFSFIVFGSISKILWPHQVSAVKDVKGVGVSNTFFENHLGSSSDSGSCSSSKLLYLVIWLRTLYQISSFSRILWCSLYCFWQTMSLTSQSFHIVVVVSCLVNSIEWYDFCSLQHCCNFTCGNIFFEADHFTITKAHLISILACKRPY